MVLRPIFDSVPDSAANIIPVWDAIERSQTAPAGSWWLITQPEHARLSGEIARHFARAGFPRVDPDLVRAIALHDAGWELFESDLHKPPCLHPDGRPVSFFEVEPRTFLQAWTASIDRAGEESAVGAYLVSQHFTWLGEYRLSRFPDPPDVRQQVVDFTVREKQRQAQLFGCGGREAWNMLLPLLQFCDLLSLYLCSGSRQVVEFPQQFGDRPVTACFQKEVCILSPTPFAGPVRLEVEARRIPPAATTVSLPLAVQ